MSRLTEPDYKDRANFLFWLLIAGMLALLWWTDDKLILDRDQWECRSIDKTPCQLYRRIEK